MKPTINTSLLVSSCTTAGINPSNFVKSINPPSIHHQIEKARWFPSGPSREHDFVVDRYAQNPARPFRER
jgi:hypothetical protein